MILRHRILATTTAALCCLSILVATSIAGTVPPTHSPLACNKTSTVQQIVGYHVPKANRRYHITIAVTSLAELYYQDALKGAKAAAKEAGVNLSVVASQGFDTAPQQLTKVENAVARGTDALVLGPADPFGLVAGVDAAAKKGIPVIDFGTLVNSPKAYQIQQDDYRQGVLAADAVAKELGSSGGEGIVMAGPANATWSNRRAAGFADEIKKYPSITVNAYVNTLVDPAEGLTKFNDAATVHPKVDFIYTVYNYILTPQSVPGQYKNAIYLGGALEPATLTALQDGSAKIVLADHAVSMGYIGVAEAVQKLNGGTPLRMLCLPNTVITKSMLGTPIANLQYNAPPARKP